MSKPVLTALVGGQPRDFEFDPVASLDLCALMIAIGKLPAGVLIMESLADGTNRDTLLSAASQPSLVYTPETPFDTSELETRSSRMVDAVQQRGFLYFTDRGWDHLPEA